MALFLEVVEYSVWHESGVEMMRGDLLRIVVCGLYFEGEWTHLW